MTIRTFRKEDQPAFEQLNTAWIEEHFVLEEKDRKVLSKPEQYVLGEGGTILFADCDGETAGCCALTPLPPESLELNKMAVSPSHRRKGVGKALLQAAIDYARHKGYARIYLESNTKLPAAIRLYEKCGFQPVPPERIMPSVYGRVDVRMELFL